MKPLRHPAPELWLDYACGQLDSANRVLLDAHLACCPDCLLQAAQLVAPGAARLETCKDHPTPALLEGILARLERPSAPTVQGEALPLPPFLWPALPALASASWRGALTPGFRFLEWPSRHGPGLYLIHMKAGRSFPRHSHRGLERSQILLGGLQDESGVLEAGDFEESGLELVHAPQALPDEDCWLLATLEGGIRFQGWRGWLQGLAGA